MMKNRITVNIPASKATQYDVLIGTDLFNTNWIPKQYKNIIIITDHKVKKHYGIHIAKLLQKKDYNVSLLSFPSGEKHKTIHTKLKLEKQMLDQHHGRDSLILALGGGVVGDLAGFIAATYMRGIAYIQMPTTLLAMVDSSLGGKTGIDTPQGKNLIGAYWQPKTVLADIACLKTLPKKHIINGLIEALKAFLIQDKESFTYLQKNIENVLNYDMALLSKIVKKAAAIKIAVVEKDEKDNNLRAILNFGHTIGHAIELVSEYKILHGYAVAYGILVEAKIAELMGILSPKHYFIIENLLKKLGISGQNIIKWNMNKIIDATMLDKKAKQGQINYVLLQNIGSVYQHHHQYVHAVPIKTVKKAFLTILGASSHGR